MAIQLRLPGGTTHVRLGALAHLIAEAICPNDAPDRTGIGYGLHRAALDDELQRAVDDGAMPLVNPLTFAPHSFPLGAMREGALVSVEALRQWLSLNRPMVKVVVGAPGSAAQSPREPLMKQNRQRVLDALRAAGFDPLALPAAPAGKSCIAKAAARSGAALTTSSFDRAWRELTSDGELRRASNPEH